MLNTPLVSICVIAYNSSRTILESLDSAVNQTYPYLELIISDDCSTDDTVDLCRQWLQEHQTRFESTKLILRKNNGGVAQNDNTAISAATGEWIKCMAGDDILLPDCIADNMAFVEKNKSVNIVFSKSRDFFVRDGYRVVTDSVLPDSYSKRLFEKPAPEQHEVLLSYNFVPATTAFERRSFAETHPYSDLYPFCEDLPQWIHITAEGEKLYFFDKETVLYRREESLSLSDTRSFVNLRYFDSYKAFFFAERYMALKAVNPQLAERWRKEFLIGEIAVVFLRNKRTLFNRIILLFFKFLFGVRKIHFFI